MEPNFIETLSDTEAQQLKNDIEEAKQRVLSQRTNARLAELTQNYRRDLLAVPRGKAGDSARKAIKDRARRNGVDVDAQDFS